MMLQRPGMGEYPGYYCYDAARPSWLPYWLDDFTESACKWSPKTVAGNIAACGTGDPSCGTPGPLQQDPTKSGPGVAAPGEETNVPVCTGAYSLDVATNTCKLQLTSPILLLAAGGLVAFLFLARGTR
jgi:hypothetical protein